MSEQPPSIWGMDRAAIEQTLVEGRSPRREYTEDDKIAIRAVLDQPDFDEMAEEKRATAFQRMHNVIAGRNEQPSMTSGSSSMAITGWIRSEEHTSELQSLMRLSDAVFCLTKTNT